MPCNTHQIYMASIQICEQTAEYELNMGLGYGDTGSSLGVVSMAAVCYGQCYGQPELIDPSLLPGPDAEFPCSNSLDCLNNLGSGMCNFDYGTSGFCEPCNHYDYDACIASSFITQQGTDECVKVCVDGNYDDQHPPYPDGELPCSNSLDCRDGHELGHWMCNFDNTIDGFCEPCDHHYNYDACIASSFITQEGTDECLKVCVDGNYDGDQQPTDPTNWEELTCSSSVDCRDGHGLGHWMCNFDNEIDGFCEPCDHHHDYDACIASTFITNKGTDECFKVCVDENYDESPDDNHPTPDPGNWEDFACSSSVDCRDLHGLGHWMCNFDYGNDDGNFDHGDSGFCEPCDHHHDHQACIDSSFITMQGTDECIKVCVNGDYDDHHPTPDPGNWEDFVCSSSIDCRDRHGLGHWMCNFDHEIDGFCEPCDHHQDYDACIASTFITQQGRDTNRAIFQY